MAATPKIVAAVVALLLIASAFAWVYRQGGGNARSSIERQNNEAGNQSDDARSRFGACLDGGRVWDFGAGKCSGPAPGGRR